MALDQAGLDHWADILVLVFYLVLVLAVGLWSLCRPNRGSVEGYFLAGKSMHWWPVGASLFGSNIGSEHFIGLAGTGAASGVAIIMYEWSAVPLLILLSWIFLPVYLASGVYTLPEFLQKRFGGQRLRIYLSCMAVLLYVVTKIAVCIYAGGLFIQLALGWDIYVSIAIVLLVTGIYTILGGLAAVIYTDTFQSFVMVIGSFTLSIIGFIKIGGYEGLKVSYMNAVPSMNETSNSTCGLPREDAFHIFRDATTGDLPWPGLILQTTIGCMWYFCADQVIVQRSLAAKNLNHAKGAALLAGYLKLLPIFLMVLPGMMSRALYPDEVGCVDPEVCDKVCNNPVGCSNIAYPLLVLRLLPVGLRGLLMAVMISAIMSSLTSIFNSASALFTMDLWHRFRQKATDRELLIVGRIFIVVLCVVSILWIPMVTSSQGGQLFNYIQAVQGYLGTPIGVIFFMAIMWKRMNEQGAFYGILISHGCGIIRMVIDFVYPAPGCDEPETRPAILYAIHYSHFGPISMVIAAVGVTVISLLTEPMNEKKLRGVTWWTRNEIELEVVDPNLDEEEIELNTYTKDNGDTVPPSGNTEEEVQTRSLRQRWLDVVCGTKQVTSRQQQMQFDRSYLNVDKRWTKFININAVISLMILMLLIGIFF